MTPHTFFQILFAVMMASVACGFFTFYLTLRRPALTLDSPYLVVRWVAHTAVWIACLLLPISIVYVTWTIVLSTSEAVRLSSGTWGSFQLTMLLIPPLTASWMYRVMTRHARETGGIIRKAK